MLLYSRLEGALVEVQYMSIYILCTMYIVYNVFQPMVGKTISRPKETKCTSLYVYLVLHTTNRENKL